MSDKYRPHIEENVSCAGPKSGGSGAAISLRLATGCQGALSRRSQRRPCTLHRRPVATQPPAVRCYIFSIVGSVLGVAWSPVRPWPMRQPAPLGAHAHDQAMVLLPVQKLLLVQPQHRRETQQEPRGSSAAWSDIWWSSAVGKYASDSSDREVRQLPWLKLHFVLYARTSPALSVALLQTARCGHCFICSGCRRLPFLAGAHRHLHQGRRDCSRFHYRQSRTCL